MSESEYLAKFNWPIVGHESILWYLQNSISKNQLNHAYLFAGPESIGKTTVTQCFVSSLLCKVTHHQENKKAKLYPCKQCVSCKQYFKELHPDIYWVRIAENEKTGAEKKNISISQIRDLQSKLSKRSFLNSYKVAIIQGAEKMNLEAANSLLKTLEEPSKETIIILLTSDQARLPQTIVSRCQVIKFLPVAKKEIIDYLVKQDADKKTAQVLADICMGRPGIAINFLDDKEGLEQYEQEVNFFIKLSQVDLAKRFNLVTDLLSRGENIVTQAKNLDKKFNIWLCVIRDMLLVKKQADIYLKNSFKKEKIKSLAANFSNDQLVLMSKNIETTRHYLKLNINPKLSLENLLINL